MTRRRLALSNKKIRNIPRRLKALAKWSTDFEGCFPDDLTQEEKYCHWKIPVITTLVEGKQATPAIRKECAQQLINAAGHLLLARPAEAITSRIVASIVIPDMFSSEVCIYTDLDYHRGHIPSADDLCCISDRSLAAQWGLALPEGMSERGIRGRVEVDQGEFYEFEHWHFGEVD